jgi:hypothetical protein
MLFDYPDGVVCVVSVRNVIDKTVETSLQFLSNHCCCCGRSFVNNPTSNRPWVSAVRQLRCHHGGSPAGGIN